jgi:putative ABC transport system permease protein
MPILLSASDIATATCLLLLDGVVSLWLGLGLHKQIGVAALRMVLQLLLIGVVLRTVFSLASPGLTLLLLTVMVATAAREVAVRPELRLVGAGNYLIGATTVAAATGLAALLALTTAIRPQPWFDPHYAIPLVGFLLGSILNAASLGLDGVLSGVVRERVAIEAQLALGAARHQALRPLMRSAIRRALVPIINQMSASGLITLPGLMTGQLIAGIDPILAAKYQILLMFLLSGGAGLAAVGAAYLAAWQVTDARHRLRLDRLRAPGGPWKG